MSMWNATSMDSSKLTVLLHFPVGQWYECSWTHGSSYCYFLFLYGNGVHGLIVNDNVLLPFL